MAKRLPTVGVGQLNLAKLSPQAKAIIRRQSKVQANRVAKSYLPQIQAIAAQRGAINTTYRQEVGSARGAVGLEQAYLGKALRGARSSGLQGQFLKQYTGALGSRMAGSASTIPFLTADAAVTRAKDQRSLSSDILKAKADMATARQKTFATEYGSGLTSARLHAASALKAAKSAKGSGGLSTADQHKIQAATTSFKDAYGLWKQNTPYTDKATGKKTTPQQANPLQTAADWRRFAVALAASPAYGISLWESQKVVQHFAKPIMHAQRRQTRKVRQRVDPGLQQLLGIAGPGTPPLRGG